MWHPNNNRAVLLVAAASALFMLGSGTANGDPLPEVSYSGGSLTVKATKAPLFPLLESIAEAANVEFYISEGVEPGEVTVEIRQEPLDRALKRVLDAFNHTMTYEGTDGAMRVAKVYIYSKEEAFSPSYAQPTKGAAAQETATKRRGHVPGSEPRQETAANRSAPQESPEAALTAEQPSDGGPRLSEVMSKRVEMEERKAFNEIAALKSEIRATEDPEKRAALNLALANKLSAFEREQRINQSKIEALYRIELFHEMKNNPEKGVNTP